MASMLLLRTAARPLRPSFAAATARTMGTSGGSPVQVRVPRRPPRPRPRARAARRHPPAAFPARGDRPRPPSQYMNPHRSNAEELIDQVPVIKVKGNLATCNGGGGALGHPIEYITLNKIDPSQPTECKYCGLRYVRDPAYGH